MGSEGGLATAGGGRVRGTCARSCFHKLFTLLLANAPRPRGRNRQGGARL